jgi:phosphate transport system protein
MATSGAHTVKAFDEELNQLRAMIAEMGGLSEAAIRESMRALMQRDNEAARRVVENDRKIDELQAEVERRAIQIIALRAPMADDLREVIAALKIASVVERMGDYAKNIAKRVPSTGGSSDFQPLSLLPEMARIAGEMVHNVLNAFVSRDAEMAVSVCERDRTVDDFYNSIFRALLTFMMEDSHNITPATQLLFIAKNLERIGDHATNAAEMVYFAATGRQMAERTRGEDPTRIDPANG